MLNADSRPGITLDDAVVRSTYLLMSVSALAYMMHAKIVSFPALGVLLGDAVHERSGHRPIIIICSVCKGVALAPADSPQATS